MSSDNLSSGDEKDPLVPSTSDQDSENDLSDDNSEAEGKHKETVSSSEVSDPRFEQPNTSPYKRIALIVFTVLLFWVAFSLRRSVWEGKKEKIIYASRYSKEHKFRPAASPVITETLKDGRIRIRGAGPTATPSPRPTVSKMKSRRQVKKSPKRHTKKTPNRK